MPGQFNQNDAPDQYLFTDFRFFFIITHESIHNELYLRKPFEFNKRESWCNLIGSYANQSF